jgi:hypothetical protein
MARPAFVRIIHGKGTKLRDAVRLALKHHPTSHHLRPAIRGGGGVTIATAAHCTHLARLSIKRRPLVALLILGQSRVRLSV